MLFVESSFFAQALFDLWDDDEYGHLQDHLARHPEAGAVVSGTGGVRKMRWKLRGRGKRGGARVIYYYAKPRGQIWLLMAYAKSEQDDLTPEQERQLRVIVERWSDG
jgi:hypothetical protein